MFLVQVAKHCGAHSDLTLRDLPSLVSLPKVLVRKDGTAE